MTNAQRRKQLNTIFGSYGKRLESLYDKFVNRLAALGYDANVLEREPLFHFDLFPELRESVNNIFADYVQDEMLAYKAGITDGVALAYSHDKSILTGFTVLSDKAISQARDNAVQAFLRGRLHTAMGLNLSHLVWNYAQQAKSEFEVAISNVISDGLKKGTSAEELGRMVRHYLNHPDMMYRRYHHVIVDSSGKKRDVVKWHRRVIDENGKVRFLDLPLEKVGTGHYRSARMNALRLMRSEINMAYHRASCERWQQEPFVIGIRIWPSDQHPEEDICDELKGDYPKDFMFIGWHPACMDTCNPILITGDEKKEFYRRLASGENMSGYVSPNRVQDVPQAYKDYIEKNHSKIVSAAERGKLAYHLRENTKYWLSGFSAAEREKMGLQAARRIKTEAEKADIQRRWDERRQRNAVISKGETMLQSLSDYPKIDTMGLEAAVKAKNVNEIESILLTLEKKVAFEKSITPNILLDSVMRTKYGNKAVDDLYANVARTISNKVSVKSTIEEKITALRFEADWVVKNRSFSTVQEVAAYYEREARRLEYMRDFDKVKSEIETIENKLAKYGVKPVLKGNEWYNDIKAMESQRDKLVTLSDKADRIEKIEAYLKTSKSTDLRAIFGGIEQAVQQHGIGANIEQALAEAEKKIQQLEKGKAARAKKRTAKLSGKQVTVEDIIQTMGGKAPKTLENLADELEKLERSLINHSWTEAERDEAIKKIKEVLANGDYGMSLPRVDRNGNDVIDKLFSSYFKNQIETGTGKGWVNVQGRMDASTELFGTQQATAKPIDYEKYGFLMDKDILRQAKSGIAGQYWAYGDGLQVRFKKDKVIATFTMEDSLSSCLVPSLTTDPKITSFGSYNKSILHQTADHASVVESTRAYASSYIELQYHGKLTLDCIESVFIPEDVLPKISAETLQKMRATQATLYSEKNGQLIIL